MKESLIENEKKKTNTLFFDKRKTNAKSPDKKTELQKMLRTLHLINNSESPLKTMISNSVTLKSISASKSTRKKLKIPEKIATENSLYSMYTGCTSSTSSLTFLSPKSRSIFDASKFKN